MMPILTISKTHAYVLGVPSFSHCVLQTSFCMSGTYASYSQAVEAVFASCTLGHIQLSANKL